MNFIIYDLILLVLFVIFVSTFLYIKRDKLKKEGLLFLYKTEWGIKLINRVGNKYKKTIKFLSYVSISLGYVLMAGVIYLFYTIVKVYIFRPDIVARIKVPPIMPLVPYIDKVVPDLPAFYFTYWIIVIAIIAVTHEFSHGIFAAYNKVKIKRTGFGFFPFFLPIFLAAFVELDEEKMAKKKKFSQMAILSAGVFANILTAIFFIIIIFLFFATAFAPAGVSFDVYAYSNIPISNITSVNGILLDNHSYEKVLELANMDGLNKINVDGKNYFLTKEIISNQIKDSNRIFVYDDAPAIKSGLHGIITEIDGIKITSRESLSKELKKHSPGDEILITTKTEKENLEYQIKLEENPMNKNVAWLGVGYFNEVPTKGIRGTIYRLITSMKEPNVYYESKLGDWGNFIFDLLWWIILISFSVALVNMLPVGIFDGGRFFYLTILGITKNEKAAKKSFSFMTYLFLLFVLVLMIFWAISFIKA